MCSGATDGENTWENVFHLVLVSFSVIVHILISEIVCIMYLDYFSRSFEPFPSSVCNISWPSHRTFFPLWAMLVLFTFWFFFFRLCPGKKREKKQFLLNKPQKIFNFCDKTVIFNVKIVLFYESIYFHLCNKNTESHGKNLILRILRKMSCNVSLKSAIMIV